MNSNSFIQVLVVLLSLSNTEANYCNILSKEFQQEDVAHRCNEIHTAVVKALQDSDVYQYILHEVFGINAFHRPPTAIIFHYVVKIITDESITSGNRTIDNHFIGPVEVARLDKNDNIACEKESNCTFDIGWSSASIYTFVRPEFILSLQPAWFLNSLKFSINEHVGFSRNVTLHVPLQRHSLPINTTAHEIMHSLQHATAKVTTVIIYTLSIILLLCFLLQIKANNASLTYIWKPISKTDPMNFIEIIYTMVVLTISSVSIVFLFYIIPYSKSDELCEQYPLVWIGFVVQWWSSIGLEIYHAKETYDHSIYGNMRILIMVVAQPVIDIICLFIFLCMRKCRKPPKTLKAVAYYAMIITFSWSLLRKLIMVLFYAFVYAAEPISTIGIVAFGVIFTVVWSYLSKGVYEKVLTINTSCVKWLFLIVFGLIDVFIYFSINAITYFAIMVYITFLNSLPKSPADGLVLKLICAFIPSLLAAGFTFCLKRWEPHDPAHETVPDPVGQRRDDYEQIQS